MTPLGAARLKLAGQEAAARGADHPGGVNAEVPADWAPGRLRPLCPYPQGARYLGSGRLEEAGSFQCR